MIDRLIAFFEAFFAPSTTELDKLTDAFENAVPGSVDAMQAELALYKYKLSHAKDKGIKRLAVKEFRLSEKGGINIMGLRRFPINLYAAELEAILLSVQNGELLRFLEAHKTQLSLQKPPTES